MKLDLRFTARPLEEVWCEIVVAFVFEGAVENGDCAFGIDAKTSGYLSSLQKRGFWKGGKGDTLLVASQGMIKADKILLKGLGPRRDFTPGLLSETIKETGIAVDKMAISDIGIRIPIAQGDGFEYTSMLETACVHLVEPFLINHGDEPDFLLKIVFSVNTGQIGELESLVRQLKEHFRSRLDHTIIFDNLVKSRSAPFYEAG
ncbi:MAG: hypothetical protein K8R45_15540 [Desulfobacterales bacterium]|nr:hypothetical protein [Desulfobacterales bacterium]